MIPISNFVAAPLNNHIYVVGKRPNNAGFSGEMIAQVFDASTETWRLLPAVPTERSYVAVVAYLEKIYVIGGLNREGGHLKLVEVFDPATNEWTIGTSLPYEYESPKARVFQDLLIVFEARRPYYDSGANPPMFYNNEEKRLECFKEASPFRNVHSFEFFTIDKEEYIDILTRENRNPDKQLEKTHLLKIR